MSKGRYPRPIKPIIYPIGPSVAYVPLSKGLHSLIDSCDIPYVGQWNWRAEVHPGRIYARRIKSRHEDGDASAIRLHRDIIGAPRAYLVDHKNGNPLDNRRSNLRLASHQQNRHNSSISCVNKTGVKGISKTKSGKWVSRIKIKDKEIHLGTFTYKSEAGDAYARASKAHHGEFARLTEERILDTTGGEG